MEDKEPVKLKVYTKQHFETVQAEMVDNEKLLAHNPNVGIKAMIEIFERQAKLQGLMNWINNLAAQYDAPPKSNIELLNGAPNGMRILKP